MKIHRAIPTAAALIACCIAVPAWASEQASAQMTSLSLGGGEFQYTIGLTDTGTTNIQTFWYSWIPGQDYMPVSPTAIQQPADWSNLITGGSPGDGYAIQWVTSSSPLTPGSSFDFSFDSTATPATLAGNASFHPGTPIGTSFIYSGAPFSDAGFEFVVDSVPEPSALKVLPLGAIVLICLAWRRFQRKRTRQPIESFKSEP